MGIVDLGRPGPEQAALGSWWSVRAGEKIHTGSERKQRRFAMQGWSFGGVPRPSPRHVPNGQWRVFSKLLLGQRRIAGGWAWSRKRPTGVGCEVSVAIVLV